MLGCDFENGCIHRLSIQVHADDGFGRGCNRRFKGGGVEGVVVLFNLDEFGGCAYQIDAGRTGNVGVTRDDDFVAVSNIQCV